MLIYRIHNKITSKSYIGQTVHKRFNLRYSGGRWWDITDNPLLKAAYNKYGKDAFAIEILEENVESIERLNKLEEEYAEKFNAYKPTGYNLVKCGDNRRLLPHHIELMRKNNSKSYLLRKVATWELIEVFNLKKFCLDNGLTTGSMYNMVAENLGIIVAQGYCLAKRTKEEVEDRECRAFRGRSFEVIHESGETAIITNPKRFARERSLNKGGIYKLINGSSLYYRGWRLLARQAEPRSNEIAFHLTDPSGATHIGIGVARFCKLHDLRYSSIHRVLKGEILTHKGWHRADTTKEDLIMKGKRNIISMDLIDPQGNFVHVENLRIFCSDRDLSYDSFYNLHRGTSKSAFGWYRAGEPRRTRVFISPCGEKYETVCVKDFCLKHGLNYGSITNIISGNGKSHKGWTVS